MLKVMFAVCGLLNDNMAGLNSLIIQVTYIMPHSLDSTVSQPNVYLM